MCAPTIDSREYINPGSLSNFFQKMFGSQGVQLFWTLFLVQETYANFDVRNLTLTRFSSPPYDSDSKQRRVHVKTVEKIKI